MARGEDRPVTREAITDSSGGYRFPMLLPGRYSVTASKPGYSTVTLVGVVVHPGEIRRTTISTATADEEELVTETVSDPILPFGLESLSVLSPGSFDQLPTRERTLHEMGRLFPGGESARVAPDIPVDGYGQGSVVVAGSGAAAGRIAVEPRSGLADPGFGVFLRYGDRLGATTTESATGARKSEADRFDGVITLAGSNHDGSISAFGLVEHVDDGSEYVVRSGGIDSSIDGKAFDAASRGTTLFGSLAALVGSRQSMRLTADHYDGTISVDASPLTAPDATRVSERRTTRAVFLHEWQVSSMAVNDVEIHYSSGHIDTRADTGNARLFDSGYVDGAPWRGELAVEREALAIGNRFAVLAGRGAYQHELRARGEARLGLRNRLQMRAPASRVVFLGGSPSEGASDLTNWTGRGGARLDWDEMSLALEDVISIGRRTRLAIGTSATWWDGSGFDQSTSSLWQTLSTQATFDEEYLAPFRGDAGTVSFDGFELDPRVSLAFDADADGRTVVLASWGRYHEAPDPSSFAGAAYAANGSLGVSYHLNDNEGIRNLDGSLWTPGQPLPPGEVSGFMPNDVASPDVRLIETERLAFAFRRELGELSGLTLDVVSSKVRNLPNAFRANPRLDAVGNPQESRRFPGFGDFRIWQFDGEADLLQVIAGARTNLFEKIDAVVTYTWSDADGNASPGTTTLTRPYQPDRLVADDAVQNPLDPRCKECFGPLDDIPKHRLSIAASVRVLTDWDLGLVFRYRSGLPYTRFSAGLDDLDRDGFRQDLVSGAKGVNDAVGPGASQLDLRIVRHFEVGGVSLSAGLDVLNVFDDRQASGLNRFGEATSFAGDPGEPPARSVSISLRVGG